MATIHPYKGYLNTKFHIFAKGVADVTYSVYANNNIGKEPIMKGTVTPNRPHSFKPDKPGTFHIDFSDGSSSEILVEDGYKFGGSEKKAAYIFDTIPWIFLVMRDRTYFYNKETDESYVEPISPDSIEELSDNYVILGNNSHPERTVYSLNEQKPILNISNIIYFNDETVIWEEDNTLNIYSFKRGEICLCIHYKHYIIDTENRLLIYANDQRISQIHLEGDFSENSLCKYKYKGEFLAFINYSLSAICSCNDNITYLKILNHLTGKIVKELKIDGRIASVNSQMLINVNTREDSIRNFDIKDSEFPEAAIDVVYSDITFYPCDWDIFYVVKTTKIYKSSCRFNSNDTVILKSINSDLEQPLRQFSNEIILTDTRFVLYNSFESFVRSKDYSAAGYREGGRIYVHGGIVILSQDDKMFTLSKNGYWDKCIQCDYDFSKFEKYGIIFNKVNKEYCSLSHNIKGKEIKHSLYPEDFIILGDYIIFAGKDTILKKSDFRTFSQRPFAISPNHLLGIDIRDSKVYFVSLDSGEEKCHEILIDQFDTSRYQQVLLSESATQILYRNSGKTEIKDILTGEVVSFDNISYVEQCNGIRPSFEYVSCLQPRVVNPVTGQILDCDLMKKFRFISPNGKYYASGYAYLEYFYRETGQVLSNKEYRLLSQTLTYPSDKNKNTEEWKEVTSRRIRFIKDNFEYINRTFPKLTNNSEEVNSWEDLLIDEDNNLYGNSFISRVIGSAIFTEVRNISDNSVVAKIDLGLSLEFLNYVSFSYDSRFVALACKKCGFGLFLVYDIEFKKTLCEMHTKRAVWTTSFSLDGAIAAYTSNPDTIYFNHVSEFIDAEEQENDTERFMIHNRNFLTFSPDGKFLALSNQGYLSKYGFERDIRNGWGHLPSTFVEIRNSSHASVVLASFQDLSDSGIADSSRSNSVASVSFSNDNSRLMMVGEDGVVIIRNLHLGEYAGE